MTHSLGTDYLNDNMARVGLLALKTAKVVGGIAVIENGYDELADVYALRKEEIPTEEPKILNGPRKWSRAFPLTRWTC